MRPLAVLRTAATAWIACSLVRIRSRAAYQ